MTFNCFKKLYSKGASVENKTNTNNKKNDNTNTKFGSMTSPISQKKLVSKVNALTSPTQNNSIINPHSIVFNTEKGSTLNYKFVVDELVKLATVDNTSDLYNKIHSIILQIHKHNLLVHRSWNEGLYSNQTRSS